MKAIGLTHGNDDKKKPDPKKEIDPPPEKKGPPVTKPPVERPGDPEKDLPPKN